MSTHPYDVIVVGARVAGAATAMLLARAGLRVLVVDQARFPSDTLSSHQVQVPGIARLRRWGLLDSVASSGAPATKRVRFDPGHVSMEGRFLAYHQVDALYSPRRIVLDALLVDAARVAGAEVRDGFRVDELVWSDGRVVGISGRERGTRASVTDRARLIIGADGKRSFVAKAVGARAYLTKPATSVGCYTYWSGVPATVGNLYQRPGRAVAVFPTNDDLTMVYVGARPSELAAFRADPTGRYLQSLDQCADLGDRVRQGHRAERFRLAPDLPNTFRVPYGPGWALVGDAGVVMDPITAQGITNAFTDAERLFDAVADGLGGAKPLDSVLARYHRQRDSAVKPMYDLTVRLAQLRPLRAAEKYLLAAVADRQSEVDRLLSVFAGIVPLGEYRSVRNLGRLLGMRFATSVGDARLCPASR